MTGACTTMEAKVSNPDSSASSNPILGRPPSARAMAFPRLRKSGRADVGGAVRPRRQADRWFGNRHKGPRFGVPAVVSWNIAQQKAWETRKRRVVRDSCFAKGGVVLLV